MRKRLSLPMLKFALAPITWALLSTFPATCLGAGSVTIENGRATPHGTGVWLVLNQKDETFSWGTQGRATYIEAHSFPKILNVDVMGDNSSQRYVLLANFDTNEQDREDVLNVALKNGASLVASLFGDRNDQNNASSAQIRLTGQENSVLCTELIIGGQAGRGSNTLELEASGNQVTITGPLTIEGTGGETQILGGAGFKAENNGIIIQNSNLNLLETSQSSVMGGALANPNQTESTATGNFVKIEQNSVVQAQQIFGAKGNGQATSNTVSISKAQITSNALFGGYSINGTASNNKVSIENSQLKTDIYGGYSESSSALSNVVSLSSGSVEGTVFAAYSGIGQANNNKIEVNSAADQLNLSNASLNGGAGSGNTLAISEWSGSIKNLSNFDQIVFSQVAWRPSGTLLTVTGNMQDISNTNIAINTHTLGDETIFDINLPDKKGFGFMFLVRPTNIDNTEEYGITQRGWVQNAALTKKRAGVLKTANTSLIVIEPNPLPPDEPPASLPVAPFPPEEDDSILDDLFPDRPQGPTPNKQVLILNDSREASISFVNQGSDHVLSVLDSFSFQEQKGIKTFASVYGQVSKYRGHEKIQIKGSSLVAGLGDHIPLGQSHLQWGIFAEVGLGSYHITNSFKGYHLRGNGHSNYEGGGVMVKWINPTGPYIEGAFRAGSLKNKLKNGILEVDGTRLSYTTRSYYLSTIVGAGVNKELNGLNTLNVGVRYLYGNFGSDDIRLGDNNYKFASVNSNRLQIHLGNTFKPNTTVAIRTSIIGEREFSGRTKNKVDNLDSVGKGLKGNTVIGDVSTLFKINPALSIEARVRGFVGKREGVSGKIQANYYW